MRQLSIVLAAAVVGLSACGTVGGGAGAPPTAGPSARVQGAYVNVVKVTGIAWFDRMATGVKAFHDATGIAATQTGPATASTELQVGLIQSLIPQKPVAMTIVPLDPGAVENVIKQVRQAGIVVVTHEAPSIQNADADIEPFDNTEYGKEVMDSLGECMHGKGKYVQFVGSLTSETHMDWAGAGLAHQQSVFPGMSRVGTPVESGDNADTAYQKTKELLQAHPDLTGFFGDSSEDVPGIGRAIQEAGLQNQTCVVGTGIPSETKSYLQDGSIDGIFLWDPAKAGQAMLSAAREIVTGSKIAAGTNLGIPGYTSLVQSAQNPKTFHGDAIISVTKANLDQYDF